ncbi:hypothetical protein GUITHDRAFT_96465 [Guillardia theta CCMP2712]|uniref:Isocitrate lyase n=2 Tax=Guillardia theta TaxID=55529 RepID=L1IW94_GUITC|nr:hypothetical protein GUITHDRAFT_96465 [Guillardia theta CCMP2712]EKX40115.1 hypothetical protein GUITHDRAFT_96465 [Guillardia theta CCMP2712]|mmetsp:Transcript_26570/g.87270  ORF Transcript_26570/g.87270 Transcript_26570/m.87270 type:complete len:565 (+) Transcript_26570:398-2092(+)|eukprot:XP_005827095.1 hypothetical protein GUITHDRAFT_96465 [Guillardia theta CCMP2712]
MPAPGFGDSKKSKFATPPPGSAWAPFGIRSDSKNPRHMISHEQRVKQIEAWMFSDRFKRTFRNYNGEDVARLRGSVEWPRPASSLTAAKLFELIKSLREQDRCTVTFGCLDVAQLTQMVQFAETIYVSGWQASSHHSTLMEPGPDLADYPFDTVPKHVERLFRAQQFHDRKQFEAQWTKGSFDKGIDYLRPIIADGDTGHGGMTAVMRLTKSMVESGASGIHFEDQKHGAKKCGHMGGKVLVSTREHIDRLMAARLQCDILGADTVLVARTDAEAAKLIESNQDPRDHVFIQGTTDPKAKPYRNAESPAEVAAWKEQHPVMTYHKAVLRELKAKGAEDWKLEKWNKENSAFPGIAHEDARILAKELLGGQDIFWCWELPRTREGYFAMQPGIDSCIHRLRHFAPYADILWAETAKPILADAQKLSKGLEDVYGQGQKPYLAYNLSPSFNWDAAGMTDAEMHNFCKELGKLGFVWQFVTLAGFHISSLSANRLCRTLVEEQSMLGYVEGVQRPESEEEVDTLTHQKWSGADLIDRTLQTMYGVGFSTAIQGEECTEKQFGKKSEK